jgi:LytS/YehU family sensor histidine kinase
MEARFGSRLKVTVDSAPELSKRLVPAFLLQPLVENAIKHHPMEKGETVEVAIAIGAEDHRLVLTVQDNGPGLHADSGDGLGLANLRARLSHLYGTDYELSLQNRTEGGLLVTIRIPERGAG